MRSWSPRPSLRRPGPGRDAAGSRACPSSISMSSSSAPASPASAPAITCRPAARPGATRSWKGATTSAGPGTCSATPGSAPTPTCSRSAIPSGPGREAKAIADGPAILKYLRETAREFGIDRHIRFQHRVRSASWSSAEGVLDRRGGGGRAPGAGPLHLQLPVSVQRLLRLRQGLSAGLCRPRGLPGTAGPSATLARGPRLPRPADRRDRQRRHGGDAGPRAGRDRGARDHAPALPLVHPLRPGGGRPRPVIRRFLPERAAHRLIRWKNVLLCLYFYQLCRRKPERAKRFLRRGLARELPPDVDIDVHFKPRYEPWDQRLCLVPDGDLFRAMRAGRVSVVTDEMARFTRARDPAQVRPGAPGRRHRHGDRPQSPGPGRHPPRRRRHRPSSRDGA